MGRKTRRRLNDEDDKDKPKVSTDIDKDKDTKNLEREIENSYILFRLEDDLFEIIEEFRKIDPRLEWVSIADILSKKNSHGIGRLKDDRDIRELSHLLYHTINRVRGIKKILKYSDLNPSEIYNRIASKINFWYIDMIDY